MEELTEEVVLELGYFCARRLANGEWLACQTMAYTTGLFVVTDLVGYRTRYCYEHAADAVIAFLTWDGHGDPPGAWIKQKPEDRMNPNWLAAAKQEITNA